MTSELLSPELLFVCSTDPGQLRGGPSCLEQLSSSISYSRKIYGERKGLYFSSQFAFLLFT